MAHTQSENDTAQAVFFKEVYPLIPLVDSLLIGEGQGQGAEQEAFFKEARELIPTVKKILDLVHA